MSARKWKIGCVVIESPGGFAGGMTFKTSHRLINIAAYPFVFIVHVGLVVLMAIGAGKNGVVRRVGVALHA